MDSARLPQQNIQVPSHELKQRLLPLHLLQWAAWSGIPQKNKVMTGRGKGVCSWSLLILVAGSVWRCGAPCWSLGLSIPGTSSESRWAHRDSKRCKSALASLMPAVKNCLQRYLCCFYPFQQQDGLALKSLCLEMSLRGQVFLAPLRTKDPHKQCQGVKQDHREREGPRLWRIISLLSAKAEVTDTSGVRHEYGTHCLDPAMPLWKCASGVWRAKHGQWANPTCEMPQGKSQFERVGRGSDYPDREE